MIDFSYDKLKTISDVGRELISQSPPNCQPGNSPLPEFQETADYSMRTITLQLLGFIASKWDLTKRFLSDLCIKAKRQTINSI